MTKIMVPVLPDEEFGAATWAPRQELPPGARLTIIDNGKPKTKELLSMIADGLKDRIGVGDVVIFSKGMASRIVDDDEVAELAASTDVVISGLGDCGTCSACSLADAIKMESAGIPSTVVISDVFVGHVAEFAGSLRMRGYHSAVVPHPVSSKSMDELQTYADKVLEQVAAQLTGSVAPTV